MLEIDGNARRKSFPVNQCFQCAANVGLKDSIPIDENVRNQYYGPKNKVHFVRFQTALRFVFITNLKFCHSAKARICKI